MDRPSGDSYVRGVSIKGIREMEQYSRKYGGFTFFFLNMERYFSIFCMGMEIPSWEREGAHWWCI